MGKYVYIDKDSKKGRFGIGVEVFNYLANQALQRVPGLVDHPVETGHHHHHLHFNSSEVDIHRGVVYVKINVNAMEGADLDKLKNDITEEVNSSFMMVAEQVPVEVKIKVENII